MVFSEFVYSKKVRLTTSQLRTVHDLQRDPTLIFKQNTSEKSLQVKKLWLEYIKHFGANGVVYGKAS